MKWIVATTNPGKRREFSALLGPAWDWVENGLAAYPEMPPVVEDGDTFAANAIKKAVAVSRYTGLCALADDSGLVVDHLDGRPGVWSARYAGAAATDEENNQRLVEELEGVPMAERTARYVAVIATALPKAAYENAGPRVPWSELGRDAAEEGAWSIQQDCAVLWGRASCEGTILEAPRGTGGFGYDPYFWVEDWDKTMAEVPLAQKNTRSHRALALQKLSRWLAPFTEGRPGRVGSS